MEKNETLASGKIALSLVSNTFVPNTSVFHNGITENSLINVVETFNFPQISIAEVSTTKQGVVQDSTPEIGITEVSTIESTLVHFSSAQVGIDKGSIVEVGFTPSSLTQISTIKDGISQINSFHTGSLEISPTEIGIAQVSTLQNSSFQIGSTQVSPAQVIKSEIQTNFNEIKNFSKVSLSGSVSFQEFFNIHNLLVASINTYKDNLLNLWQSFTDPTNPFDINFIIKDLPTGQLAQAQITEYDLFGRPAGGTFLIDTDANGKGWFIDPTPFDNSEFNTVLSDSAFRAAADSPAFGHYDVFTALLHEMGHLAGFIDGYSGFDSHIQTVNGSRLFVTTYAIAQMLKRSPCGG